MNNRYLQIEQSLNTVAGFSEELQHRGYTPSSKWIERIITLPSPEEQLRLGLFSEQKIARLERLRLADDITMSFETSVIPQSILPDPFACEDSLYEYLGQTHQAPTRALQYIRACNANTRLANLLTIPIGCALLYRIRDPGARSIN